MCKDCRDQYIAKATSNEISWQGDTSEELEICLNDSLTYVGNILIEKVEGFLKGEGIIVEDLSLADCAYLNGLLGVQEKSLLNLFNIYKQAICELKEANDLTEETIQDFTDIAGYTLGCLAPVDVCGDPLTFKGLIQNIITKLCALNTQFEGLAESLLDAIEEGAGNFLVGGAIKSCGNNGISYSGSGAGAVVTFQALVPPYCPIIYTGSTAYFDVSGAGLPNTPYCGWFLCNGNNGTPNSSTLPQNGGNSIVYIIRFT